MREDSKSPVVANPWNSLRRFTSARIALGRSGTSLPTAPHLEFQLAHARARKAVHHALDAQALASRLQGTCLVCLQLQSAATTRTEYLQRPDKGRQLDAASKTALRALPPGDSPDIALVVGDGLSALAIEQNVKPFLDVLLPSLRAANWSLAPLAIVTQARVAIGDEIGELLRARAVVVMIGERPGLSSPDSMGLYLTFDPRTGLTDERRNCISNVRPEGLSYERAAHKLVYLIGEAFKRCVSGVDLKDEADDLAPAAGSLPAQGNFLTAAHKA